MNISELKQKFIGIYGGNADNIRVFSSPGRVNLIGEHTDYTGGYVFPAALTMGTTVLARKRDDNFINLAATDLDVRVTADIDRLIEYKELKWGNYQLGTAYEMQREGYEIIGCDLLYHDTVPHGSGLSSSAAIEVATAVMLATFSNEKCGKSYIDMVKMALISQRAENNYIGVNCGIMDQFASAMGRANHAIFLRCNSLKYSYVPLELEGYKLIISNTNKKRSLTASKYNERRDECEEGFAQLHEYIPLATCLGDISPADFEKHCDKISNEVVRKRVAHVVYENRRVLESVETLKNNDIARFGELMNKSHISLKSLYEVTGMELDTLASEAWNLKGVLGSRMTGAGFGGCTVSIVKDENVTQFIETIGRKYQEITGLKADFYISEIGDGGREIV